MFTKHDNPGYRDSLPGIRQKTQAYGGKTLMVEFQLQKGAVRPMHRHPHEQTGYLVSGCMDLTIGNETRRLGPDDSWCVPGNTEHGTKPVGDSVAVKVFSPVREDSMPERGGTQ